MASVEAHSIGKPGKWESFTTQETFRITESIFAFALDPHKRQQNRVPACVYAPRESFRLTRFDRCRLR